MGGRLKIYVRIATADQAACELEAFEEKSPRRCASIALTWRMAGHDREVIPFFAFDPAIRKIICTNNAIESLNRVSRKSIKTRGSLSPEEAATKLIYLAIRNIEKDGWNTGSGMQPETNSLSCSRSASKRNQI